MSKRRDSSYMFFLFVMRDGDDRISSLSAATPELQRLPRAYWIVENKAAVLSVIYDAPKDDAGKFALRHGGPQCCRLIEPGDIVRDEDMAIHYDLFEAWIAMTGADRGQMVAEGRQIQRAWESAVQVAEGNAPFQNSENTKLRRDGSPRFNKYESAGKAIGVSRDLVWKVAHINECAPEVVDEIRAGKLSVNEAWTRLRAEGRIVLKRPRSRS